jgi:hypothetical protein
VPPPPRDRDPREPFLGPKNCKRILNPYRTLFLGPDDIPGGRIASAGATPTARTPASRCPTTTAASASSRTTATGCTSTARTLGTARTGTTQTSLRSTPRATRSGRSSRAAAMPAHPRSGLAAGPPAPFSPGMILIVSLLGAVENMPSSPIVCGHAADGLRHLRLRHGRHRLRDDGGDPLRRAGADGRALEVPGRAELAERLLSGPTRGAQPSFAFCF